MKKSKQEIINSILKLRKNRNWLFRIKTTKETNPTIWSSFFISPTDNYIETDIGPISFKEIDYIDISIFEEVEIGRLVPKKKINNIALIKKELDNLNTPYSVFQEFIRISFNQSL